MRGLVIRQAALPHRAVLTAVLSAVVVLSAVGPATALPASPWAGTWEEVPPDERGPFEITQSGNSLQILYPCELGASPDSQKNYGKVTSADGSVSEWTYSGEPECPNSAGTYTATMSDDARTVHVEGVTVNGTPFTQTWTYKSGGTEPRSDTGCARGGARVAAINEVRVVSCKAECEWRTGGGDWRQIEKDTILQQGHEISCDPDGELVLAFADNSTVTIHDTTQLKIASFFTEGGIVRTELLLAMGKISAKVNKSETTRSDFKIKPPAGPGSVRGTTFSVFYDPISRAAVYSVIEGLLEVDPAKPGLKTTMVGTGKEVEVTRNSVSRVVGIGKAGARGGINRATAIDRALARVAAANQACSITTPRKSAFSAKGVRGGWAVTVKVTGRLKGKSKWKVTAAKTKPTNARAKKIAAGCS